MKPICLLCHEPAAEILETIAAEDLDRLWKAQLGHSVREELGDCDSLAFCRCTACGLAFFSPAVTGSESFYRQLAQVIPLYYMDEKPEYAYAVGLIGPHDAVLEIGAGKGAFARQLNCRKYVGLELSGSAIEQAGGNQAGMLKETVEEHARRQGGSYDVACAFQVLEHVADVRGFVAACVECLGPGGRLIFSVPAEDSFLGLMPNATLNLPPHHASRWPHRALRRLAEIFNLELVALEHEALAGPDGDVLEDGALKDIRVREYARVVAAQAINRRLGRKNRVVDLSPAQGLVTRLASVAGRFFAMGLRDPRLFPAGHSVTAVYRKKDNGRMKNEEGSMKKEE